MPPHFDPDSFAKSWAEAWNAHDLNAILAHFAPGAVFWSPLVPVLTGKDNPLRGRDAMRAYWEEGLRRLPNLHFTVETVYAGAGCMAIAYRNERARQVTEMLRLGDDGLVVEGWGLYAPEPGSSEAAP